MKGKLMKIILVDIDGRLGNQMFQYAYAKKLAKQYSNSRLLFNFYRLSLYKQMNPTESGWEDHLKDFQTQYDVSEQTLAEFLKENLSKSQYFLLRYHNRWVHHLRWMKEHTYSTYEKLPWLLKKHADFLYRKGLLIFPGKTKKKIVELQSEHLLLHSYFEDSDFYQSMREELYADFTPKEELLEQNVEFYKKIQDRQSVCITIRRGDYLTEENQANFFQCDESYFVRGIEIIKEKVQNPVFFLFSDDLDYAQEFAEKHLSTAEFYVEKANNPLWEKVRLMRECKHFIISNSTFSWWAQFLSSHTDKIVVGPKTWYPEHSINKNNSLVQDEWIKL